MSSLVGWLPASEPVLPFGLSWLLVPAAGRRTHYPVIGHLPPHSLLLGCAPLRAPCCGWLRRRTASSSGALLSCPCSYPISGWPPLLRCHTSTGLLSLATSYPTPITIGRSSFAVGPRCWQLQLEPLPRGLKSYAPP